MTIYRATAPFFADGMCHPVRLDAIYEATHELVVAYPAAFETITTLDNDDE